jgi:hypothetical protein
MEILSAYTCAERLGTTVSGLRHFLNREQIVPHRRLQLGGNKHVRYFTAEDFQNVQEWWQAKHAPKADHDDQR